MEINEEKRMKFMENAGKRVNKVMHDIQILDQCQEVVCMILLNKMLKKCFLQCKKL